MPPPHSPVPDPDPLTPSPPPLAPVMAARVLRTGAVATAALTAYVANFDVYAGPLGGAVRRLDAESAHRLGVAVARLNLVRPGGVFAGADAPVLRTRLWGMDLASPLGLAAGFDKDGEAVRGLFGIGFAAVEVGTVVPVAQSGNEAPRVFRLAEDRAIINRYGFNSLGVAEVRRNLVRYDFGGRAAGTTGAVGVNVGRNKVTKEEHAVDDYVYAVKELGELADYLVVNVSSPNTPGLRKLQGREELRALLGAVLAARDALPMFRPPVLLKIAPDLSEGDKRDIADVVLDLGVDGIIVSNTTVARPATLRSEHRGEAGGLSGRPLKEMSTAVVRDMWRLTGGKVTLVGVGGVESGQDAYEKICAGASFVQVYSALVYEGPWVVWRIKKQLAALLERDGFASVADAVGSEHGKRNLQLKEAAIGDS